MYTKWEVITSNTDGLFHISIIIFQHNRPYTYIYDLGNRICWISHVCNLNQIFFSRVVFSKFICCFWTPAIVWYSWQNTVFKKLCLFLCLKKACGDMLSIVLWRHVVHCVMDTYCPLCYGDILPTVLWRHIVHCVMETYSSASSSESFFQLLELKWKETQFPECILFGILGDAQSPETKYLKLQPYTIDI